MKKEKTTLDIISSAIVSILFYVIAGLVFVFIFWLFGELVLIVDGGLK